MALELNLTPEDRAEEGFKPYPGSNLVQRPLIVEAKRIPMRAAHLMGMRILHPQSDWITYYFDCDDRIAYHPDGERFKIGSLGTLEDYAKQGTLVNGAMEFDKQRYLALPWKDQKEEIARGRMLLRNESVAHPLWFELSGRNQHLLNAFVATIYDVGRCTEAMGVYLDDGKRTNAWMRAFFVDGLVGIGRSKAVGGASLDFDVSLLVGIAPEALVRLEKRLRDEKGIHVDFVRVMGEERVAKKERIIESRYDIGLAEGEQQYFREAEVDEAFQFARQSGQTDAEKILEIARQRLLSRREVKP